MMGSLPIDSTNGLCIMAGIPRGIEDDDTVGTDQVDAEASGSRRDEEQDNAGVGVELVDQFFAFHSVGAAVQTEVGTIFSPPFVISTCNS